MSAAGPKGADQRKLGGEEDGEWAEWEEDAGPEHLPVVCPFTSEERASASAVWDYAREAHSLDMASLVSERGWDELMRARLINFLRRGNSLPVDAGGAFDPAAFEGGGGKDDANLAPVLADDPLLFDDPFLGCFSSDDEADGVDGVVVAAERLAISDNNDDDGGIAALKDEMDARRDAVMKAMESAREPRRRRDGRSSRSRGGKGGSKKASSKGRSRKGRGKAGRGKRGDGEGSRSSYYSSYGSSYGSSYSSYSSSPAVAPGGSVKPRRGGRKPKDGSYFESYARYEIHEDMIKDAVRTDAYRDAIEKNPDTFKGKVVLDIGCGTGILSMFCARAGARRVIGIDLSDIADTAKKVVERNGLSDVVTIVKGRVEDVTLPDGIDKVDVIVSEWMGYALLYESMLGTVLAARDRWLAPGGKVFPDLATIRCVALERDEPLHRGKIQFWDEVYGFDMRDMAGLVQGQLSRRRREPVVEVFRGDLVASGSADLRAFDARTMRPEEQDFITRTSVTVSRDSVVDAMLVYFDIDFRDGCEAHPVFFTTGPQGTPTHWMQVAVYLPEPATCRTGDVIECEWAFERRKANPRTYSISISYKVKREGCIEPIAFGGRSYDLV